MASALISAGAAIVGSAITSSATRKASKAATQAAEANNALLRYQYEQSRAALSPYIERGTLADARMAAFLGLGGDAKATQDAFQGFLDSTGYQFQLDEGLRAVTGSKAAAGMLNSGSTLRALNTVGQNTARTWANQYLGYLGEQAGRGMAAAGSLGSSGFTYAQGASENNNRAADARGNAALSNAANLNSLLGSAISAIGNHAGMSSYGKKGW